MEFEDGEVKSLLTYNWTNKQDLLKLLESKDFLQFVEDMYNDLVQFYNLTNGLNGIVTADALNTSIAYSSSVRHEMTLLYEVLKELDDRDKDAFEDFKAEKEIEVRKRENRSDLAGTKWLAQSEIAKYAKMENFEEYKEHRTLSNSSHNKCRYVLRLLENLKIRSEDLKTISSNARTDMNNLNIDAFTMSLEKQALKEAKDKNLLKAGQNRRRRAN